MSLNEEISRGAQAQRLIEELQPFLEIIRAAILEKWEKSPIADREGQHELRLMRKLLGDLEANLKTAIETGKLANIQIEQESALQRTMRKIF